MKNCSFHLKLNMGNLRVNVILNRGFFYPNDPWTIDTHCHSDFELHYIYDGNIKLKVQDSIYSLKKGSLYLTPPFNYHSLISVTENVKRVSLMFSLKRTKVNDPYDTYQTYVDILNSIHSFTEINISKHYFLEILDFIENAKASDRINLHQITALFTLIFTDIAQTLYTQKNDSDAGLTYDIYDITADENYSRKIKAETFISHNFKSDITIKELAENLNLSIRQTTRFLNEEIGLSFSEFMSHIRIAYAKTLIESSSISLQDIAYETGYNSYNGFSIAFKRHTTLTPTQYAKLYRKK